MTTFEVRLVVISGFLVVLAAILAATETSVARVTKIRAHQLQDESRRGAGALVTVVSDSAPYISVSTFLRVVCESFTAVCVTIVSVGLVQQRWLALLTAAGIMAVLSFVLVGVSPRTLGRQHAESVALLGAPLLLGIRHLLGPVARLLVILGNAVTPGKGLPNGPFATESELRELLDLAGAQSVIEPAEQRMLHSVFEFGDTLTREVMVPRTDMVTIDDDRVLRQALSLFLRSGFSRIPVISGGPDDICGMLYLKDVTKRVFRDAAAEQTAQVTDVMRRPHFVPENKLIEELLREMQRDQSHVAVVVDEYGGTAGLVTIEDILEEIVGEIADEYDREDSPIEELPNGEFRLRANFGISELGDLFGRELSDEDVDTVGGLLAKALGRVPIPGAVAEISGIRLTAERRAGRRHRIATVLARELPDATLER